MHSYRALVLSLSLVVVGCGADDAPDLAAASQALSQRSGTPGWNILGPSYGPSDLLDGLSLEWDYFMIHDDDGDFTGIVGYVLADPRGHLGDGAHFGPLEIDLMPSGGNVAIAGELADGRRLADYEHFGLASTTASGSVRALEASDPATGRRASLAPASDDELVLEGESARFAWSLLVAQDWAERGAPAAQTGRDVGRLPGEHWTVDMLWPRTRVTGWILDKTTGESLDIDGHGYRENSFGRWAFVLDGWDFAIVSDAASGVHWAWQTYHKSTSMDFLDVSFVEGGQLRSEHFRADARQLGWRHDRWRWDRTAHTCVPLDTTVVAENERYRVEARVDIGDRQVPLLSNATWVTNAYVIMEHFPAVTGRIVRRADGATVATFAGQAGGEIAYVRHPVPLPSWLCGTFGAVYRSPMP